MLIKPREDTCFGPNPDPACFKGRKLRKFNFNPDNGPQPKSDKVSLPSSNNNKADDYKDTVESPVSPIINNTTTTTIETQAKTKKANMNKYSIFASASYLFAKNNGRTKTYKLLDRFLPGWEIVENLSDNYSTVFKNKNDIVISYRGTNPTHLEDLVADTHIAIGNEKGSIRFQNALSKYNLVKQIMGKNSNVIVTGHSLGGSLAHYVAKNTGAESHLFNLGSSPLDFVKNNTFDYNENIYHIDGDPLSMSNSILQGNNPNFTNLQREQNIFSTVASNVLYDPLSQAILGIYDSHGFNRFLPKDSSCNANDANCYKDPEFVTAASVTPTQNSITYSNKKKAEAHLSQIEAIADSTATLQGDDTT